MNTSGELNEDSLSVQPEDGLTEKALPLTPEQIKERNKLVEANIGLVVTIVKNNFHFAEHLHDDLVQEGMLGLMAAAERFDTNRGYKFSTFASYYIRGYILIALKDKYYSSPARIPINQYENIQKLIRARKYFIKQFNKEPDQEDLATIMGKPINKIEELLNDERMLYTLSLDAPIGEDGITIYAKKSSESPDPEEIVGEMEYELKSKEILDLVMKEKLTERDIFALVMKYNQDMTLKDIGKIVKISRERVRQIIEAAQIKVGADKRIKKLAA